MKKTITIMSDDDDDDESNKIIINNETVSNKYSTYMHASS